MASSGPTRFVDEARRRQVFAVLAIYVVGSWVVLQVAATLFPGWHIPDEAIRFVWIGAVLLCPIALIFGWYYDVSVRGLRRTSPTGADTPSVSLTRKDFGIISLLLVLSIGILGGVAREVLAIRETPQPQSVATDIPENSIAVLPFVNMSDDAGNEYFSDGITEQLLNELTRVSGLHVAARTSSFYYKNKNESMRRMGQELGVKTLLEGSVRKVGNKVRITAQLINADDGYHLWSQTYDRALDDIFSVQDEISQAIVKTLKIEFLAEAERQVGPPPTDNVEAYDRYLRALAYRRSDADNALEASNEYLQEVIDLAPDFALAYDALAYGYLLQSYNGSMAVDDATARAEVLLVKALELQPDLEEAHASLGLLKSRLGRYAEANEHYTTALQINPNYFGGQVNYGLSLVHQSRLKEASAAYLRAQALDPLNANLNFNLGALMMLMGQFDNGYQFMQKAWAIQPKMIRARAAATHWLGNYGKLVEAVQNGEETLSYFPDSVANITGLVGAYMSLGLIDDAKRVLTDARSNLPENGQLMSSNVQIWLAEGDQDSIARYAETEFALVDANIGDPLNFADRIRVYRYAWSMLLQGKNESASELFYWVAGGADGIAQQTYDQMTYLKMLALSYLRTGRQEEADALLDQCLELVAAARDNGWATPFLHVRLAEVYLLRGESVRAIENLEIAFNKGWRGINTIETGIVWQDLQGNPELERIKVEIYEDLEIQKEALQSSRQR